MNALKKVVILCWIHSIVLSFQLIEKTNLAQVGDYALMKQDKNLSFLYVAEKTKTTLVFEEISFSDAFLGKEINWESWYKNQAPGHTSWFRFTMRLEDGLVESLYSVHENRSLQINSNNTLLKHLFFLPFQQIPYHQRKKLGSNTSQGVTQKMVWNPPLSIQGRKEKISSTAWKALWPKDTSALSGKTIEMYLVDSEDQTYPSYFPIWIEVSDKLGMIKLRTLEIGRFVNPGNEIP